MGTGEQDDSQKRTDVVAGSSRRLHGTMLWFNEAKDAGVVVGPDGEQLPVKGRDFTGGHRPQERCAKTPISFELGTSPERRAVRVEFVPPEEHGRARFRRSTMRARY